MYAVIETSGKQFIAREGEELVLDKIDNVEKGKEITFDKVLLHVDKKSNFGTPYIENASVTAVVEEAFIKDKKVVIMKYKRKTGYMKKTGHRQQYTIVKVKSINT